MKSTLLLTAAFLALATPSFAHDGVAVRDAYARIMGPTAKSGAAFMVIENHSDSDDRLIAAASDIAERTELHTHQADGQGNMQMRHVPEGFEIPAHSDHALARSGDHVMFMGLRRPVANGDVVSVTLTFERAGDVVVEIPVDLDRKEDHSQPAAGGGHGH